MDEHTQYAYLDQGDGRYTVVHADSLAEYVRARARDLSESVDAEQQTRQRARSSCCAGKLFSSGILFGEGKEV